MRIVLFGLVAWVVALTGKAQTNELAMIDSLFAQKEYRKIIQLSTAYLENSEKKDSAFAEYALNRAYAKNLMGDYEGSIPDWLELIELRPAHVKYYNSLAYAYWTVGELPLGLEVLKKAYSIDSTYLLTLSNLAFFSAEFYHYEYCVKYASEGLSKEELSEKDRGLLLSNRANGYNGMGKYEQAEKDANESIALFPDNSFAFYYRAVARFARGKTDAACQDLMTAKSLGGIKMTADLLAEKCN